MGLTGLDLKLMNKFLIAFIAILPICVLAEKQGFRLDNWAVTFNAENKSSLVYGLEKSDVNTTLPQLFLLCSQSDKKRNRYRMGLLTQTALEVEDPNQVDVALSIDDKPKMEFGWFQANQSLQASVPRQHIKEMLTGSELHVHFRDKTKLHKYTYALNNFPEVLNVMEEVCMYKFE